MCIHVMLAIMLFDRVLAVNKIVVFFKANFREELLS